MFSLGRQDSPPAFSAMPVRHAVLLSPSLSSRPVSPYFFFSNSFLCHRSENSPISPAVATLPKAPVSNPCVCHTSETPRGSYSQRSNVISPIHILFILLRTLLRHERINLFIFNRFRTLC